MDQLTSEGGYRPPSDTSPRRVARAKPALGRKLSEWTNGTT